MKKSFLDYTLNVYLPITALVVALSFVTVYFAARPERTWVGYHPQQPIEFPHDLHAGTMGIDCMYCHTGASQGRHATVPAVSTCMNCHTIAGTDKPEVKKLLAYANSGESIPWKRVHKVPEHVYFNHSVHVNKGIKCSACHGAIEKTKTASQVNSFMMGDCLSCHRTAHEPDKMGQIVDFSKSPGVKNGPEHCFACHR